MNKRALLPFASPVAFRQNQKKLTHHPSARSVDADESLVSPAVAVQISEELERGVVVAQDLSGRKGVAAK